MQINKCPTCRRPERELHIGKSSGGWKFAFAMNGDEYHNIQTLKKWLIKKEIRDEYGRKITHKTFWNMVEEKQKLQNPGNSYAIVIGGYDFIDREFS